MGDGDEEPPPPEKEEGEGSPTKDSPTKDEKKKKKKKDKTEDAGEDSPEAGSKKKKKSSKEKSEKKKEKKESARGEKGEKDSATSSKEKGSADGSGDAAIAEADGAEGGGEKKEEAAAPAASDEKPVGGEATEPGDNAGETAAAPEQGEDPPSGAPAADETAPAAAEEADAPGEKTADAGGGEAPPAEAAAPAGVPTSDTAAADPSSQPHAADQACEPTVTVDSNAPAVSLHFDNSAPSPAANQAEILQTLNQAVQALTESAHLVDDPAQREQLLLKQQQLREHCVELQLLLRNSKADSTTDEPGGFQLDHVASLVEDVGGSRTNISSLPAELYENADLKDLVQGLDDIRSQSPLLRSLADGRELAPGTLLSSASRGGGPADDERPMSVASSEFEREVEHVRQIRRKIDLAKDGKNVVDYDEDEDAVWYEIDDAERDVVDLRRMRRQIRCLFGTQPVRESVEAGNGRLLSRFPDSPTTSVGSDAIRAQALFDEYGAVGTTSPSKFGSAPNKQAITSPVIGGQASSSSRPVRAEKDISDVLKHAGANWAEEVVKAAVQPGNQWSFSSAKMPVFPPDGGRDHASSSNSPKALGRATNGSPQPPPAWLTKAMTDFRSRLLPKTASGDVKIMNLGGNRQYIGDLSYGKPDGYGVLVLADGSQHVGQFRAGRANGDGVFLSTRGSVLVGEWAENRRVGDFRILDHNGNTYLEKYELGERVSRERLNSVNMKSMLCIRCQSRYFAEFNHGFGCRTLRKPSAAAAAAGENADPEWKFGEHAAFVLRS